MFLPLSHVRKKDPHSFIVCRLWQFFSQSPSPPKHHASEPNSSSEANMQNIPFNTNQYIPAVLSHQSRIRILKVPLGACITESLKSSVRRIIKAVHNKKNMHSLNAMSNWQTQFNESASYRDLPLSTSFSDFLSFHFLSLCSPLSMAYKPEFLRFSAEVKTSIGAFRCPSVTSVFLEPFLKTAAKLPGAPSSLLTLAAVVRPLSNDVIDLASRECCFSRKDGRLEPMAP